MITLTVSFNPSKSNAEAIAEAIKLLAGIDAGYPSVPSIETIQGNGVNVKVAKKPRKVRVYTEEEKAAFRARMVAGRKAKEAEQKAAESKSDKPSKVSGSKKLAKTEKSSSETPMPRAGRKVEANPGAE